MHHPAVTTEFLIKTDDYYVERTNRPSVRIGVYGCICFEYTPEHPNYNRVANIKTLEDAEDLYLELYLRHYAPYWGVRIRDAK